MQKLTRYSKPRGAGDQTSGGRGKLLRATTDLTRVQVLVRETLQNSWDAALDDWHSAYGVYVRKPSSAERQILLARVFADLPNSLGVLHESLSDPDMHVMEVYDRGTTGLNGPYRAADVAADPEKNNFNSFVFDIGTTKTKSGSGGTFGFGKTASFEVSRAHSVVYWSRCENEDGELEHRLIATSLHDPYNEGALRYTGAHWWGEMEGGEIIPLRGEAAQAIGEALFRTPFAEDETGTSILILDPEVTIVGAGHDDVAERRAVRSDGDARKLVEEVISGISDSAWPKTITKGEDYPPMLFHVYLGDEEIDISDTIRDRYAHFAVSLTEVRRELQELADDIEIPGFELSKRQMYPITLSPRSSLGLDRNEIFNGRTDRKVGVLHLMVTPQTRKDSTMPVQDRSQMNRLCLMRDPEFVVFYDNPGDIVVEDAQWTGVFKTTPECDAHFAAAEPPTHDAWSPHSAGSEISEYVVRRTLENIRKKTKEFLEGERQAQVHSRRSVRDVANALSGFLPVGRDLPEEGAAPSQTAQGGRRARTRRTEWTEILGHQIRAGGREYEIEFAVSGSAADSVRVTAKPFARTADGRMPLEPEECTVRWQGERLGKVNGSVAEYGGGARGRVVLRTQTVLALDFVLEAEVA